MIRKFTEEELNFIKDNYEILSLKEIAEKLDRGYEVVKHKCQALKLSKYSIGKHPNCRGGARKYEVNNDFFSTPNSTNSYWSGFIAADGYIKDLSDSNMSLSIMLAEKDVEHLENFKSEISCTSPLWRGTSNGFNSCSLTIASTQICEDLKVNYNIVPRKTFLLSPPNITQEDLIDSYIVGYIDGDGSISMIRKRHQFQILSTLKICEWIRDRFIQITNRTRGIYIYPKDNQYTLMSSGVTGDMIYNHYKNLKVPMLQRKWGKVNTEVIRKWERKVLEGITQDTGVVDMEEVQSI